MVEPLLIAGAAAAYLLLKPKKMTPEEAQEQLDEMPQEQLEEQVPPTVTVTPAPTVVDPDPAPFILGDKPPGPAPAGQRWEKLPASRQPDAPMVWRLVPAPKTCVLVKRPKQKIPTPPQVENYYRKSEKLTLRLATELRAAEGRFSEALKGFPLQYARVVVAPSLSPVETFVQEQLPTAEMAPRQAEPLGHPTRYMGYLGLKPGAEWTPRPVPREQAEEIAKNLGLTIDQVKVALKAFDEEIKAAKAKAVAEKMQAEREVRPFMEAWKVEKQKADFAASAEFQAKLQEYESRGWSIHQVKIRVTHEASKAERLRGFRSVVYACPPGVEPEALV